MGAAQISSCRTKIIAVKYRLNFQIPLRLVFLPDAAWKHQFLNTCLIRPFLMRNGLPMVQVLVPAAPPCLRL
jgi:hypothetical protein